MQARVLAARSVMYAATPLVAEECDRCFVVAIIGDVKVLVE